MQEVNTAAEAIDALGGNGTVAELFGVVPHAVSYWRKHNRLPRDTKDGFLLLLEEKGFTASPKLWRMRKVSRELTSAAE
jgi:hypothetical protein